MVLDFVRGVGGIEAGAVQLAEDVAARRAAVAEVETGDVILVGVLAMLGLWACSGLAQDINKGAGTTEREVNKGTRHERTISDGGPGAVDAADGGAISM